MAPPPARRGAGRLIALIVTVLAVAAGGTFAVRAVRTSSSGGGSAPEAAVRSFLDAAAHEDVLGLLGALLPSERDALLAPIEDLTKELVRLGILAPKTDLANVAGLDLEFKGLKLRTTMLDGNHAIVESTGGTATVDVDPRTAPVGSFVRNMARASWPTKPLHESNTLTGDNKIALVAVRDGGRWYTSLLYSAAEGARRSESGPTPRFGAGLDPIGSPSAEEAVRALVRAVAALDFQRVIQLLAPDESAALRDYADLFIDDLRSGSAQARRAVKIELRAIDVSSERSGDATIVKIRKITFGIRSADGSMRLVYEGNCLLSTGLPLPPRLCGDQFKGQFGLKDSRKPVDLGFWVVQRDGQWYVSPIRTLVESITALLRSLTPKDLEGIGSFLQQFGGRAVPPSLPPIRR